MEPPPRQCVISANAEPHYKRSFPRLMVRARGSSYIELNQAAVQYSDSTGPRIRTRQRSKRKRNARSSSHWPSFTSRPLNLHKQDGGDDDDDDVRATNGDAQKGSIADLAWFHIRVRQWFDMVYFFSSSSLFNARKYCEIFRLLFLVHYDVQAEPEKRFY